MLVFDTNVISETMRRGPNPGIIGWIDRQPADSFWTTSVTVFEILVGIERMDEGKRKRNLREMFEASLVEDFNGRILDFDTPAASAAATIANHLYGIGQAVEIRDLQIAGIVHARKATLVTRNVKDFQHSGIKLINPWEEVGDNENAG